jgi:phage-related protein
MTIMGLFDFLKKKTTDVADHPVVNNAQDAVGGVVDNASSAVSDIASSVGSSVGSAVDNGVDTVVDKTADAIKSVTPDSVDGVVDKVADAATGDDNSDGSTPPAPSNPA